jgi:class 3 adenylate cyclase
MSDTSSLPKDPALAQVATQLDKARGASFLCDDTVSLVWISDELRKLMGNPTDEELGLGKHIVEAYLSEVWSRSITLDSHIKAFVNEFPMLISETPGGKEGLKQMFIRSLEAWETREGLPFPPDQILPVVDQLFEGIEAVEPAPFWVSEFEFVQGDLPPANIVEFHIRLHDKTGRYIGTCVLFDPGLPASVLSLVARGDEAMFGRMARLTDPGRRKAAVLFADLQASSALSRRLPSAAYFKLIRAITTAMDECIIEEGGIVGKHAGDGVTAFFLSEDLGSESAAASAAVRAARKITETAARAAKEVGEETGLVESADCHVNVGLHWGGAVYMGQIVTGGRLEVTALGDRVNEAARIQESARDGEILVSKTLLEHLTERDAEALGVDPDAVTYRTISDLPSAPEKAVRDAGGVPVTIL